MNGQVRALPQKVYLGRFKGYTTEKVERTFQSPRMDTLPKAVTIELKREVKARLQANREQFLTITAEIDKADSPRVASVDTGRRARLMEEASILEELIKRLRSGSESTLPDQNVRPGR